MKTAVMQRTRIDPDSAGQYLDNGQDFIQKGRIELLLEPQKEPEAHEVRDILSKSVSLQRLGPIEAATLLRIKDPELWQEAFAAAGSVKDRVYGARIVTFAPLYCSNMCENSCVYCGFRRDNSNIVRRKLSLAEIRQETKALISLGHKRLIVVFGEHSETSIAYITDTIKTIYATKIDRGEIRRVNLNAAPMSIEDYRLLEQVGLGTCQVFQETYHRETYRKVHPKGTKADYRWRLYALHRAQEAGIDDVAVGALFGLYDWRFEVLGLLLHTIDLEEKFLGVGPHTVSFPRVNQAINTRFYAGNPWRVGDEDLLRAIAVLRLSIPYTGMIITAREPASLRRRAIEIGCTQTDGSARIAVGSYARNSPSQQTRREQFTLNDSSSLDEIVYAMAEMGMLASFCTAGYRCGRTGRRFMEIAKQGKVHEFCVPNAILTLKEYLLDFASQPTREIGQKLIEEQKGKLPPSLRHAVDAGLRRIETGERDVYL